MLKTDPQEANIDPQLASVIEAWPNLPEPIRRVIVSLADCTECA